MLGYHGKMNETVMSGKFGPLPQKKEKKGLWRNDCAWSSEVKAS